MYCIEDNNFLSEELKEKLDNLIFGSNFPFYYNRKEVYASEKNSPYLSHTVLKRPYERKQNEGFNSEHFPIFLEILTLFCKKNNIKLKEILRIAVNLTYNNGEKCSPIHQDHHFPHNQLLIYLNTPIDKNAKTVIYDDNEKTILKKITPEKFKGVCFENKPHSLIHPTKGDRLVLVYTFI